MKENEIYARLINHFFPFCSLNDFLDHCPNRMMWEAFRPQDGGIINVDEVISKVNECEFLWVLQEPLSNTSRNQANLCTKKSRQEALKMVDQRGSNVDPIYILAPDYSWFLVFTGENTPEGSELSFLVDRPSTLRHNEL